MILIKPLPVGQHGLMVWLSNENDDLIRRLGRVACLNQQAIQPTMDASPAELGARVSQHPRADADGTDGGAAPIQPFGGLW